MWDYLESAGRKISLWHLRRSKWWESADSRSPPVLHKAPVFALICCYQSFWREKCHTWNSGIQTRNSGWNRKLKTVSMMKILSSAVLWVKRQSGFVARDGAPRTRTTCHGGAERQPVHLVINAASCQTHARFYSQPCSGKCSAGSFVRVRLKRSDSLGWRKLCSIMESGERLNCITNVHLHSDGLQLTSASSQLTFLTKRLFTSELWPWPLTYSALFVTAKIVSLFLLS